eukprot:1907580-Amphidinium_carterae.1
MDSKLAWNIACECGLGGRLAKAQKIQANGQRLAAIFGIAFSAAAFSYLSAACCCKMSAWKVTEAQDRQGHMSNRKSEPRVNSTLASGHSPPLEFLLHAHKSTTMINL